MPFESTVVQVCGDDESPAAAFVCGCGCSLSLAVEASDREIGVHALAVAEHGMSCRSTWVLVDGEAA